MQAPSDLLSSLGWLLSPTRKIIDHLKQGDRAKRGLALRRWNLGLFTLEVLACSVRYRHPKSASTGKSSRCPVVIPVVIPDASVASAGALARHWSGSVGPAASVRDSANMTSRLRPVAVYNSTHAILLPIRPRSGPNPALKRNANSVARWPSSAGPAGPFCACCPARHAAGVRLALR